RRSVLRGLAGASALAAALRSARAEDRALDALLGDVGRDDFGQGFDQASRTVHMPKATIPMLSPGTAETTRRAVETYDRIVAGRKSRRFSNYGAAPGTRVARSCASGWQYRATSTRTPAPSRTIFMIRISRRRCADFRRATV